MLHPCRNAFALEIINLELELLLCQHEQRKQIQIKSLPVYSEQALNSLNTLKSNEKKKKKMVD